MANITIEAPKQKALLNEIRGLSWFVQNKISKLNKQTNLVSKILQLHSL